MASLPWASASSHEQCFVLITGANSGVGLGIGQRLIDQFLATHSASSHLILIPTTRSSKKSTETIRTLRAYVETNKSIRGSDRVHLLSVEVDLCKLPSIYAATETLLQGKVRDPTGVTASGLPVRIPRIDAAVFNAGYGGWSGINWIRFAKQFWDVGVVQATTFPAFKDALPSQKLPPQDGVKGEQPPLAEVFCANVFGHYLLAHELLPLLSRSSTNESPARVIWTSSIDAEERHLDLGDFQAFQSDGPYESSKRITDLISLTADLPSTRKASESYFAATDQPVKPRFYLSHPGIVCTALFPLNAFLFWGYYLAMYLSRYLGSPWHPVESYLGAVATVWLVLEDQKTLDSQNAQHVKWGSSCDRSGRAAPKKTEVEGWGWEGKIEDSEVIKRDEAAGILRKLKGRKRDAVQLTEQKKIKFEEDATSSWKELERLRVLWEDILKKEVTTNKA